ncbi:unnamed protein product [Kuraishia capsulata CBS 1993]|uniref:2-hydroxyacyl-CoA lyase n=1 Tax=Kuraishia capsulata CBS 1993 TaxID=1382522 RepID=W6MKA2_9ASCO|nr:uncharacterized protein KUCA_T00001019001 [Kuraishia capsulata CBS 1993]CDK25052.1 unnamed protein product [Kuraishia capsulata CBS 1993]
MVEGANIIAKSLQQLGVKTVFGIVGIPVVEIADACIELGIEFISFRNEQAASYAASAYGYLTGRPGVLLVVGGPGLVHASAGILNSQSNRWPIIVLAGSSSSAEIYKGGFQELDQVSYISPHVKFAARPPNLQRIPELLSKAYRKATVGIPGATYVDFPADLIQSQLEPDFASQALEKISDEVTRLGAPVFVPDEKALTIAVEHLKEAKCPLVIIGKGAAYSIGAADIIRKFVEGHNLPFLPTPMAKGVVSDFSELNTSSARSAILKSADVILLLGGRLNWILHHGESPRFQKNVKFIQVDISAEDIGDNALPGSYPLGLVGDIALTVEKLDKRLRTHKFNGVPKSIVERRTLNENKQSQKETKPLQKGSLMNYNQAYAVIRECLDKHNDDVVYISEGANTMDVARVSFPMTQPKHKLDAGTNATMGVGMGYAISAKSVFGPAKIVVAIEGDSAFGFSAMEIETCVRSNLPVIVVVMNNSGVYHGIDPQAKLTKLPSTALSQDTKYELLGEALGATGYRVANLDELKESMTEAVTKYLSSGQTSVINVIIENGAQKKLQFGWQNKPKL